MNTFSLQLTDWMIDRRAEYFHQKTEIRHNPLLGEFQQAYDDINRLKLYKIVLLHHG